MATNFGTKIAINANKCICMKDNENANVNSLIAQTLSQNQTLHGYVAYN